MSCCIKCCKNRSDRMKKDLGITYHRFPKENEVWRNDWIEIIRNCNNDTDWIPSEFNVICSIHFDASDFYTTKGGRRRVITYGVPKNFLFEPMHIVEDQPAGSEQPIYYIPSASKEVSTSVTVPALDQPGSSTMMLQQEYLPAEPNISNHLRDRISVVAIKSLQQPDTSPRAFQDEQPVEPNISSTLKKIFPEVGEDEEQVLYSPKKRRLTQILVKKQDTIKKQTREIKTLKQRVNRLQNRNKSLKHILKSLKDKLRHTVFKNPLGSDILSEAH